MKKITFITFYNDFSVGVNVLSRILTEEGHDVSTIFFKLPCQKPIKWFRKKPGCMETLTPYGDIMGSNSDVNRATDKEIDILIKLIGDLNPDIVCLSTRSPDRDTVLQIMPALRKTFKGLILAGGYGPTFDPETYAEVVDYVFRGEAENRIKELMEKIEKGESIENFDNIAYKRNGKLVINRLCAPDELPLREQTITEQSFYIENERIYKYEERNDLIRYPNAYSIFFGRGCISTCSYCNAGNWKNLYKKEGHIIGMRRNRHIEDVIHELKEIKNTGITFVNFRDEFLTAPLPELKRFFSLYEKEVNLPFWAYLVPQQAINHPELLEMAVDAGFVDTVVGFQSGSDYINRTYFTRKFLNKTHLEYARLLSKYNINIKYDFIVFNPAETDQHVKETFELIQELPKERSYLNCSRLLYLPGTPASQLFAEFEKIPLDFERYYSRALLYLICYVLPKEEFEKVLRDEKLTGSWQNLRLFYKEHLARNNITFPIGTHEIPGSITTHRYERILKKYKYTEVIVWGAGDYYREMAHIFKGTNITYHVDDEQYPQTDLRVSSPEILKNVKDSPPLFVCSPKKLEIKTRIRKDFPRFSGKVFV